MPLPPPLLLLLVIGNGTAVAVSMLWPTIMPRADDPPPPPLMMKLLFALAVGSTKAAAEGERPFCAIVDDTVDGLWIGVDVTEKEE